MDRQDRRKARTTIGVESLEGRRVLSASPLIAPIGGALVHGVSYVDLQGTVKGVPLTVGGIPDAGVAVFLRGAGHVHGVGPAKLTGSLQGTGSISSGQVQGTITLANGKGSLTLQLQGPDVAGFTLPGSGTYSYSVVKGTGAFKHHFGAGTVALTFGTGSFSLGFHGKPNVY